MENHSSDSNVLEGGIEGESFRWCLSFLEKRGKEHYGEKFRIYQEDHEIIFKLIVYFVGDNQNAENIGIDLQKGILLTGPIGCGKTSLMNLMRFIPPPDRNHVIKSCLDVSCEFIQEGYEVIWRYNRLSFNSRHPKIYCFDDLGTEQALRYFGNECNVMGEILLSRYEYYIKEKMTTHLTTNLSASENVFDLNETRYVLKLIKHSIACAPQGF